MLNRGKTLFLAEDAKADPFSLFFCRIMAKNTAGNSHHHSDAESSPINLDEIFDIEGRYDRTLDEEERQQPKAQTSSRRTGARGPTKMKALKERLRNRNGRPIPVELDDCMQVVGDENAPFASYMGIEH